MKSKKKNYNITLIIFIILLVIVIVTVESIMIINKSNSIKNVKNKYPDYEFVDVKTYKKSTNGKVIYKKRDSWIDDSASTEFKIQRDKCINDEVINYTFKINSGLLTITDNLTNESYTLKGITNIKSAMEYSVGNSCQSIGIVILTNDGKIYFWEKFYQNSMNIDFSTIEEEFKLFDSNYVFDEIGYSGYAYSYGTELGVRTNKDDEFTIRTYNNTISEKYDMNVYDFLSNMYGGIVAIGFDSSIYLYSDESKNITDEENNKIYINYGFYGGAYIYIIDMQGYLYILGNGNPGPVSNIVTKYSNSKVLSIGIGNSKLGFTDVVLILENLETVELKTVDSFGLNEIDNINGEKQLN